MTTTRRLVFGLGALVLVAGAIVLLVVLNRDADDAAAAPTTPPAVEATTAAPMPSDTSVPTSEPVEPTPTTPAPSEPEPSAPTTPQGATTVTVTTWGYDAASRQVMVAGYADVVESDGTCTLVVRNGGAEASVSVAALPDATTTSCGTLAIPRSQLSTGTWSAELRYASPTSTGAAAPITIEVP